MNIFEMLPAMPSWSFFNNEKVGDEAELGKKHQYCIS